MRKTLLLALCVLSGCDTLWTGFLSPCGNTRYGCQDAVDKDLGSDPSGGDGGGATDGGTTGMPDLTQPEPDMAGGPPNLLSATRDINRPELLVGSNISTLYVLSDPSGTPMPLSSATIAAGSPSAQLIGIGTLTSMSVPLRLAFLNLGEVWESRNNANFQKVTSVPGSGAFFGATCCTSTYDYMATMTTTVHAFAVGASGRIVHRQESFGSMSMTPPSWSSESTGTSALRAVAAIGEQNSTMLMQTRLRAWAVGDGGTLLERSDTGTWQTVAFPQQPTFTLYGVSAAIKYDGSKMPPTYTPVVWAVGAGNLAANKVDGAWQTYSLPAGVDLRSVLTVSKDFAIAVGAGGKILRWRSDDPTWRAPTITIQGGGTLPTVRLNAIYGENGVSEGGPFYITGDGGVLLRYYFGTVDILSYK